MPAPLEFYFDFSSPYGYFASTRIDDIGARHGREVAWRPFLLGIAFKTTGQVPLVQQPIRGDYHRHDFARSARRLGLPFRMPEAFPFLSLAAARAYYWLLDTDPGKAKALARTVYHAAFGEGRSVTPAETVADLVEPLGIDRAALLAAVDDPVIKKRLKSETEAAIARGVFGSPFVFVDGEPFWGSDRLEQVDAWLAAGGW